MDVTFNTMWFVPCIVLKLAAKNVLTKPVSILEGKKYSKEMKDVSLVWHVKLNYNMWLIKRQLIKGSYFPKSIGLTFNKG